MIEYKPNIGRFIWEVMPRVVFMAREHGEPVHFEFNGMSVTVCQTCNDTLRALAEYYTATRLKGCNEITIV